MKIEPVSIKVGDETRCYFSKITCECGHQAIIEGERTLYQTTFAVLERLIARADHSVRCYERNCQGKRQALASKAFWSKALEQAKAGGK